MVEVGTNTEILQTTDGECNTEPSKTFNAETNTEPIIKQNAETNTDGINLNERDIVTDKFLLFYRSWLFSMIEKGQMEQMEAHLPKGFFYSLENNMKDYIKIAFKDKY